MVMKLLLFIKQGRKSSLPLTATGHQLFVRRIDFNISTAKIRAGQGGRKNWRV
jgi:hypothetical protein